MRVLVTGAAGYIGSVAVAMLLDRGDEVVALDNFERGHRNAIRKDASVVTCDLRNAAATLDAVTKSNAEAVLHFAALHVVPESVERPAEYYRTNVVGGLNLLDAVRASGIRQFVFSSTATVYGAPSQVPIPETAPITPINPYGNTKATVERMIADFGSTYGIHYAILRYFNVAGAYRGRGYDHRPATHVIPAAIEAITGARDEFVLFGTDYPTPDGTAIRDYVHVADLVDAHLLALDQLDRPLGALNLGTANGFSVSEVVKAVELTTDRELPVRLGPRRAGDPPILVADSTRARDVLGWEPHRSTLDQIVGSHWEWVQEHPDGYPE